MIVQTSQVTARTAYQLEIQQQDIHHRRETRLPAAETDSPTGKAAQVRLSATALDMATEAAQTVVSGRSPVAPRSGKEDPDAEAKLQVLLKTMEKLTGKKFRFQRISFSMTAASNAPPARSSAGAASAPAGEETGTRLVETYTAHYRHEQESSAVAFSGVVRTADGREIAFDVGLHMQREFYESSVAYTAQTAPLSDPLVITYNGNAADLTTEKFAFDLNMDGMEEQISFVSPGSGGFLALDKNKDGRITDGGELFGPQSGDGFAELARYDDDRNGWIDAADQIYYDLSVWEKDADGGDRLTALVDTGIGAIYLNAAETPFRITDAENQTLGQVRATSVYLTEDGGAGTVQRIDLAT